MRRHGTGYLSGWLGYFKESFASSLWLLPTLMGAGGALLFGVTHILDLLVEENSVAFPSFFAGDFSDARSLIANLFGGLLATIATIFSIVILTLQLASSQYSPRLLKNFFSDVVVQVSLGAYFAIFVYLVLLLGALSRARSLDPVVSLDLVPVLAFTSFVLLIYLIHHVADSLQSTSIIDRSRDDTLRVIKMFEKLHRPEEPVDDRASKHLARTDPPDTQPTVIWAKRSGYVLYLDEETAIKKIAENTGAVDLTVEIPHTPGNFVVHGSPLVRVWPGGELDLGERDERTVRRAFVFGRERDYQQDFLFGIRQLADIAVKALSPAINTPTVAVQVQDRLAEVFAVLGSRELPRSLREYHLNGKSVLVRASYPTFESVVAIAFDQTIGFSLSGGQVMVLNKLLMTLDQAIRANEIPERRYALWQRAYTVARQAQLQLPNSQDAVDLGHKVVYISQTLLNTPLKEEISPGLGKLTSWAEGAEDRTLRRQPPDYLSGDGGSD